MSLFNKIINNICPSLKYDILKNSLIQEIHRGSYYKSNEILFKSILSDIKNSQYIQLNSPSIKPELLLFYRFITICDDYIDHLHILKVDLQKISQIKNILALTIRNSNCCFFEYNNYIKSCIYNYYPSVEEFTIESGNFIIKQISNYGSINKWFYLTQQIQNTERVDEYLKNKRKYELYSYSFDMEQLTSSWNNIMKGNIPQEAILLYKIMFKDKHYNTAHNIAKQANISIKNFVYWMCVFRNNGLLEEHVFKGNFKAENVYRLKHYKELNDEQRANVEYINNIIFNTSQ